ncbi:MAG TPA: phospholipase D-like domain-containing protein [Chitinophagaceae bacterium]|nr:phospholipase D-like domain-containing protein [Chitinophagaceae bacterium]
MNKHQMSAHKRASKLLSTKHNRVQLVRGGSDYFEAFKEMINAAQRLIYLQVYILDDDETGTMIADALKHAASRGVEVFVLADGYASRNLSQSFIGDMRAAGIHFRFFDPLLKSKYFYFGRRLHHKIAVADGRYALVGGINITNRYNDLPGKNAWLDFAVHVEGEGAQQLCLLCWKTWNGFPSAMQPSLCDGLPAQAIDSECEVAVLRNDWVRRKNEVSSSYVSMLRHAKSDVTILCSYFLPGRVIRRQLAEAAKRGVHIRIITTGYSDVGIAKYAERFIYRWLLRHNIEIFEYQPTVLHGKIAVCDGKWASIGSYNINNISAYASIELNLEIRNEFFAEEVNSVLEKIIKEDCIKITAIYQTKSSSLFRRFASWVSYGFYNLGFYLSTFYYRHKT